PEFAWFERRVDPRRKPRVRSRWGDGARVSTHLFALGLGIVIETVVSSVGGVLVDEAHRRPLVTCRQGGVIGGDSVFFDGSQKRFPDRATHRRQSVRTSNGPVVVNVDTEVDLCRARKPGGIEDARERVDFEAPSATEAHSFSEVAREADLAGERVAKPGEIIEHVATMALAERGHQRNVKQPEEPSEQSIRFDAGVIPLYELEVSIRERRTEPRNVRRGIRERVGVVDHDELVSACETEREPNVSPFAGLTRQSPIGEQFVERGTVT